MLPSPELRCFRAKLSFPARLRAAPSTLMLSLVRFPIQPGHLHTLDRALEIWIFFSLSKLFLDLAGGNQGRDCQRARMASSAPLQLDHFWVHGCESVRLECPHACVSAAFLGASYKQPSDCSARICASPKSAGLEHSHSAAGIW